MSEFIRSWGESGYAAFTSFGISVLSLIVAFCAWLSSSKANRRLIEIEEGRDREAERSEAKARLVAAIINPARHSYHLEIRNEGSGQARGIKVTLDGNDVLQHPAVRKGQEVVTSLGPRSSFRYILAPSLSTRNPSEILIEWSDGSGDSGRYESHL